MNIHRLLHNWGMALLPAFLLLTLGTIPARGQVAAGLSPNAEHPAQVKLLADVSTIAPGSTFTLGLHFTLKPGWHTYWLNPGESGEPAEVKWSLPEGFEVGELQFPVPIQFSKPGESLGYGYENEVMLLATVKAPAKIDGSSVPIRAEASWLVCDPNVCLPGSAKLSLDLRVGAKSVADNAEAFTTWQKRIPQMIALPSTRFLVNVNAQPAPDDPQARIISIEVGPHGHTKGRHVLRRWFAYPAPQATISDIAMDQYKVNPTVKFRITPLAGQSLPATLRSLWVMPFNTDQTTRAPDWPAYVFEIPLNVAPTSPAAQSATAPPTTTPPAAATTQP